MPALGLGLGTVLATGSGSVLVPDNALTLDGDTLTLDGDTLTLEDPE